MNLFICTGNEGKIKEYGAFLKEYGDISASGIKDLERKSQLTFVEPVEDFDFFLGNAVLKLISSLVFVNKTQEKTGKQEIQRIVVDDSGLCVPALNFQPGVHSAYFGGMPRSAERNRKVLQDCIRARKQEQSPEHECRLPAFFVCFLLTTEANDSLLNFVSLNKSPERMFATAPLLQMEEQLLQDVQEQMQAAQSGGFVSCHVPFLTLFPEYTNNDTFTVHLGFCFGEVSTHEQNLIPEAGHGYDSMFYGKQHPDLSFASIPLEQKNQESHRAFAMQAWASQRLG